jgi:single-strand DNA-binding protein
MSRAVNKAILLGRLGADPEIRYTSSGTAVVNVSLATNEAWADKEGNRQERTEWHRLVFWRQLAEIVGQYCHKGGQIYVEGTLRYRTYEDSEGRERFTTEIEVRELSMLDGPRGEELDTSFDPEELEAAVA